MLMVSPVTIRQWANKGWLKSQVTAGGHRRFSRRDVVGFARQRGIALNLSDSDDLRVLIVEDDVQVAAFLAEVLVERAHGVVTETAFDGFEAGQKTSSFNPHIILLDLMMPGINGFEVCRRLKSDPVTKMIEVTAMTGYCTAENVERILSAGARACLAKPLDIDLLMRELGLPEPR